MLEVLSNVLAAVAGGFSGAESKACIGHLWGEIECPKELL